MSGIINFEVDDKTEERLKDIAIHTGIVTKSGTIRYLINRAWEQLFAPLQPIPEPTIEQDIKRRR
jgi:hypothetical protein